MKSIKEYILETLDEGLFGSKKRPLMIWQKNSKH